MVLSAYGVSRGDGGYHCTITLNTTVYTQVSSITGIPSSPTSGMSRYVGVMVDSSGARGAKGDLSPAKLQTGLVLDRPAGGAGREGSQIIGLFDWQ